MKPCRFGLLEFKDITCQLLSVFSLPMKRVSQLTIITCVCYSLLSSCSSSNKESDTNRAKSNSEAIKVVESAIEYAGTMEKWQNIASLEYTKRSKLLLENGETESDVIQHHHYIFGAKRSINISWIVESDSFLLKYENSAYQKFKNGELIDEGDAVKSSINSSVYVLGMPFKLLDEGTELNYLGQKEFNGNDSVHVIKATYEPSKYQNHSTQDVWWYHFNNDGAFLSSMVFHTPTYALIENLSVTNANGLKFPKRRKSYRCDEFGNKVFLRAEFWYSDYSVSFMN